MMTMTKIKKSLSVLSLLMAGALPLWFYSPAAYINFTLAAFTSMAIVMGSLYSYRNMIQSRVEGAEVGDTKDVIDEMDDPYDLYEEEREAEITDIKQMIKEEKARQKSNVIKNTTQNASALVSIYRLIPYAFLVMGFIALENSAMLEILPYLVGLAAGIPVGYLIAKQIFIRE
jgi:uncharacterized membrane protein